MMEIPLQLTEFIKEHDKKTLKKGTDLFFNRISEIELIEKENDDFILGVPSQSTDNIYTVVLGTGEDMIMEECDCIAFDNYFECKHCIAGALHLLHTQYNFTIPQIYYLLKIEDSFKEEIFIQQITNSIKNNVPAKVITLPISNNNNGEWKSFVETRPFSYYTLQNYSGNYSTSQADVKKVALLNFDEPNRHWKFLFLLNKNESYYPEIKFDSNQTYSYRCTCINNTRHPMCKHVRTAFDKLLWENNNGYFLTFKDWTTQKNTLLQPYGISLEDEEAKLFEFSTDYYNNLQVKVPQGFYKADDVEALKKLSTSLRVKNNTTDYLLRPLSVPNTIIDFEIGYVLNFKSKRLGLGFEVELAKVYDKAGKTDIKKLTINSAANLPLLRQLSDEQYNLAMQLSDDKLAAFLKSKGHYIGSYSNPFNQMDHSAVKDLQTHYSDCIIKLWPHISQSNNVFLLEDGNYSSKNCKPVKISIHEVALSFEVITDEKFITIWLIPVFDNMPYTTQNDVVVSFFNFLFKLNDVFHVLKSTVDIPVLEQFSNGFIKVPLSQKIQAIKSIIAPLQERYEVRLPAKFEIEAIETEMVPQVLLKEFNEQFLMLQPQFLYDSTLVDYDTNADDIVTQKEDGTLQIIKRDTGKEKQFYEALRPLHDSFNKQHQNDFFFVHFKEVMKGNWFLNTVRYMQENGFVVKGMENLKRFRYNTNKPKWEMKTGSGIDWFDLEIKVSFGDEEVPLKDIRKAIISNQNIVVLGDGTFGVLPDEWLQQYSMLFKMGEAQKDGSMRLSKLHFTLIDQLHNQIDDEAILKEIEDKKQKLKNIDNIQLIKHSKNIKAKLRPYQLSGFQWMQTLDELGWGGCLADDMGLGKTLQAITFLQFLKEKYKGSTHLVVCPTSLIYNWENELQKFAPKLKYHIYYGTSREFTDEHFEDYDIVITSYGLIRNDMEQMLKFNWHYIILDESQAIKNPEAQITKAVQLLKAKNRLVLSGTPVQNNTFDLFAQFNFINPGILGSKEFYKTEFANPIDKNNDADKSKALRQLIYPFLLRRTKEQVAKDLPNKTETILWCQMGKEQQSVYDDYKNYYRKMLMKKIAEDGMAKAGMYVLEGLLRLRQICDSPQLVKDEEVTTKKSIKIDELVRELEENTGSHKLLVFSQFTEMLQLIKEQLQQKKIIFSYLDGSTPAAKRQEAVDNFQQDETIKVFLISLKAGGVGLNLTAADYVYIVDPWWNPAVEQQAIDRTHRIGQTKKIFAYKMICKDTVEEKIVQLQQRKKQIANDLVTEDAGFIKKLSKEDVEFLFS
jgi:superfamily II DNA or RNA helicase